VHVGDCHIWAEINYLDSANDYREFLPVAGQSRIVGDVVMLDDQPMFPRFKGWRKRLRALFMRSQFV
jgi:hypothetical protein